MRLIFIITLYFLSQISYAEIAIVDVSGYSKRLNFQSSAANANLEVWGGFAGSLNNGCSSLNGVSTCDNCDESATLPLAHPCNRQRAYDALYLVFKIKSTNTAGFATISFNNGISDTPVTFNSSYTLGTPMPAGQVVTLSVLWRNICLAIATYNGDSFSSCDTLDSAKANSLAFKIGISAVNDGKLSESGDDSKSVKIGALAGSNTDFSAPNTGNSDPNTPGTCTTGGGLCSFSLFPGDKKATITNLVLQSAGTNATYKELQFFCSRDNPDYTQIKVADGCSGTVQITGDNALTDTVITGLNNGTTYRIQAAMIDQAGNMGKFFIGSTDCPVPPGVNCQSVKPDAVYGLLDKNCFIATAAFGSPLEKHVVALRRFRDRVLKSSFWGQMFIKAYYQTSPPVARWIAEKPWRRTFTRWTLTPFVLFVSFLMDFPLASLGISAFILFGFFLYRRRERQILS